MNRIVFVDRDGVINVDPIGDYIKSWDEFRFEQGAIESLKRLCDAGLEIILISNQAGVGDGVFPEASHWDIHKKMMKEFERERIHIRSSHYCLHGKNAGCPCRKPQTGLFQEAVQGVSYKPDQTYFIGDKATDIEAGKRFGIRTIFVRTGHGRFDESKVKGPLTPDHIVNNLREAAGIVLA